MRDNERIIFDNYDLDKYFPVDEIKAIAYECEWIDQDEEPDDYQVSMWQQDEADRWIEDELSMMNDYFDGKTVIFFGTLGLWDGRHAGGKIGTFEELYESAISDCGYVKMYDNNGHLFLECSHHDGTNFFEIKELTPAGIDYMERWEYSTDRRTMQDAHIQIIKRYSKLPRYADTVYGKISRK